MEPADRSGRFRLLYELGCAFAARLDLDELLPLVISKCREVLDVEGAAVLLLDADRQELYFPFVAETDPEVAARLGQLRFPATHGIAGAVLESGRSLRIDDVPRDPRFYGGVDQETGRATRNMLSVPLPSRQGPIGVVQLLNRRGGASFDDDDLAFLEALAGSIAVAIENARLYAQVRTSEERLRSRVGVLERDRARREQFPDLIGTTAAMADVFRLMESAAASPIAVLIEGETGTGKELVARGIHDAGVSSDQPFVAVNCAALAETLLESDLFGHVKGAFTGAVKDRVGLFEAAHGGSIFLDEIGEMPLALQGKLLRVLQDGEITPVGSSRTRKVDVRVLSATNRDLLADVAAHRFREDLYYRLAAFPIRVPALRERAEDIPLLVEYFLGEAARRHRKRIPGIAPDALDRLVRFDWPGNIRELRNEIERAVALTPEDEVLCPFALSPKLAIVGAEPRVMAAAGETKAPADDTPPLLRDARAAFEARYLREKLEEHAGNVSRTARALGISRVSLQKKMKALGLR